MTEALSPSRLAWLRFKQHRLALAALGVLIALYVTAIACEFLAPYEPDYRNSRAINAPPMTLHFIDQAGDWHLRPSIYEYELTIDPDTWMRQYHEDFRRPHAVTFFDQQENGYRFFAVHDGGYIHLFGTDSLGRDVFSRVLYGSRVSLSIGVIGVFLTLFFGLVLGGFAGYLGGFVDNVVQRLIEVLQSMPTLPLWMALSAALPVAWSPLAAYFGVTLILSFFGWTTLARQVRGRFLSLRDEDFVVAARLTGASNTRIVLKHMVPNFMSHTITTATLAIPAMILGETALSFLGIGLRPPVVSWGVLLQQAQNYQVIVMTPWLLIPGLFIVITVIAFNLLGDGLRDAADPYHTGRQP